MPQKMSINPDLWKQTRRLAFDMGTTATSIVEEALIAYFAAMEVKQGSRLATPSPVPDGTGNYVPAIPGLEIHMTDPQTTKTVRLASLPNVSPGSSMNVDWGVPTSEERKQMDALPPPATNKTFEGAALISSPSEVAEAVKAAGPREFHPVPKPVAAKKARR